MTSLPNNPFEKDIYRDPPFRYLGYTNELGESFRPLIKTWMVNVTYGVAIAYVLADAQDKSRKAYKVSSFFEAEIILFKIRVKILTLQKSSP